MHFVLLVHQTRKYCTVPNLQTLRPAFYAESRDNKSKSKLRGLVEFASWFKERAAHQRMDVELYFWIDYCCLSSDEASTALAALPLFISACTEILAWRTPDFDRRGWPLMERLLAYCFCRGGLTPYAIDASTLGERDEDQEHAGLQCFPPWEGWGGGAATGHRTEQLLFCITVL
ncbi:unnamed protein product [Symbiodinium microadriaticum]|nr:unnamed protein product [Symbiodinium microadriaticum]